jgi:hypothetical protein
MPFQARHCCLVLVLALSLLRACPALADGLSVVVSSDGGAITIDGERSVVRQIRGAEFDEQLSDFKRSVASDYQDASLESCSIMLAFSVDFSSGWDVVGGICQLNRHGSTRPVAICDPIWRLESPYMEGGDSLSRHALVKFIATECAVPRIEVDGSGDVLTFETYQQFIRDLSGSDLIARFQADFHEHKVAGKITSCETSLVLPVGTAHGNSSYGGICHVDGGAVGKVAICDDDMIGHFKVRPLGTQGMTRQELAVFVAAYCTGG